jgi:hypothetical protein
LLDIGGLGRVGDGLLIQWQQVLAADSGNARLFCRDEQGEAAKVLWTVLCKLS